MLSVNTSTPPLCVLFTLLMLLAFRAQGAVIVTLGLLPFHSSIPVRRSRPLLMSQLILARFL